MSGPSLLGPDVQQKLTRLDKSLTSKLGKIPPSSERARALCWIKRAVALLSNGTFGKTPSEELVEFLRDLIDDACWYPPPWCLAARLGLHLLRNAIAAPPAADPRSHRTEQLTQQIEAIKALIDSLYGKLDRLDGNDLGWVEPMITLAEAMFVALEAEMEDKDDSFGAKLDLVIRAANALIQKASEKAQELAKAWLASAYSRQVAPGFLDQIHLARQTKPHGEAPSTLVIWNLAAEARNARQKSSLPQVREKWMAIETTVNSSALQGKQIYDQSLIGPMLALADKIQVVCFEGDVLDPVEELKCAVRAYKAAKELKREVEVRKAANETPAPVRAVDVEHSIGRRAAQRYSKNRNNFIKGANNDSF